MRTNPARRIRRYATFLLCVGMAGWGGMPAHAAKATSSPPSLKQLRSMVETMGALSKKLEHMRETVLNSRPELRAHRKQFTQELRSVAGNVSPSVARTRNKMLTIMQKAMAKDTTPQQRRALMAQYMKVYKKRYKTNGALSRDYASQIPKATTDRLKAQALKIRSDTMQAIVHRYPDARKIHARAERLYFQIADGYRARAASYRKRHPNAPPKHSPVPASPHTTSFR